MVVTYIVLLFHLNIRRRISLQLWHVIVNNSHKDMKKMPSMIFVVDPKNERIAVLEAKKLGIPVVGLVDTNCNPEDVDYAIPGNDDAIRAVKLITDVMANAVIEGRQGEAALVTEEVKEAMTENAEEAKDIEEVVENAAEESAE